MNLRWEEEAELELSEASVHYFFEEPGLEERFIDYVMLAINKIQKNPLLPREFDPPFRKVNTEVFPYQVIYTIHEDTIWIVALMHQSREPGYWKDRS